MAIQYRVEYISTFHTDVWHTAEVLTDYPIKAARIFAKIDQLLKPLETMPEMYPVYQDVPSFRFIVVEDYLVLYKVKKQEKLIEVHRLLYGRMNIPAYLMCSL